jgi:sulfotransferase family protein
MTGPETPGVDSPIFIGGLSHSGKTPLRMVLDAHRDLSLTRKTRMWDRFYGRFGHLRDPANVERCLAALLRDPDVRRLEPDAAWIRRQLALGAPSYAGLFALFHQDHARRLGKRRWGDQHGFVERYADPIFAAFPRARMIHMIRDPRDRFLAGTSGRTFRRGKLGWDTALWLRSLALAERNEWRYGDRYCVVQYEAFAAHPADTVKTVCAVIGEDCVPAMDEALQTIRFDTSRPPGRPTPAETAFVDRQAAHELERAGYARAAAPLSRRDRATLLLADWPVNRAAMAIWRARDRHRVTRV